MDRWWGGEVVRVRAGVLTGGRSASTSSGVLAGASGAAPGGVFVSRVGEACREAVCGEVAARDAGLMQGAEVEAGLDAVGAAQEVLGRARLRLACEVAARGMQLGSGFSLADWLAQRCPDLDGPAVRDLARVAEASREPVHAPLVGAVLSGGMALGRAARIHRATQRIQGALTPEEHAQAVQLLTDAGCEEAFDDADVQSVINQVLARCLPERVREERARARRELRDLHESSLADGSVRRMILTFGDYADYEAVRAVITSPLAAPASLQEQEATGVVETRTPGQRRYDAFMTVLTRGVAGAAGQPVTAKAKLVVLMDLDTLRRQVGDATPDAPGVGLALGGGPVPASSIRKLACEADLVPMVLGGPSEIVDQGRAQRLVTPGQRLRLAVRDRGCTIPGCTVPAGWCDAHHVIAWSRGGRSDLSNYALLCPRHHTFVHDRGLTATVTAFGVTWHLR